MHTIFLCFHYLLYCIYYATASCVHCCVLSLLPTGGFRLTVNNRLVGMCVLSLAQFTQSMAQMHLCASVRILTHSHTHMCVLGHQCVAIFCTDCFVLLSFSLVWSLCTAMTLVISCECPLFTVGEGAHDTGPVVVDVECLRCMCTYHTIWYYNT